MELLLAVLLEAELHRPLRLVPDGRLCVRLSGHFDSVPIRVSLDMTGVDLPARVEGVRWLDWCLGLSDKASRRLLRERILGPHGNLLLEEVAVELVQAVAHQRVSDGFGLVLDDTFKLVGAPLADG